MWRTDPPPDDAVDDDGDGVVVKDEAAGGSNRDLAGGGFQPKAYRAGSPFKRHFSNRLTSSHKTPITPCQLRRTAPPYPSIDTSRDWKQDALLVADSGNVTPTPAYYVFRHFSQFVEPGAKVVKTTGGDAVAFKNPDGSLVAVMYSSGSAGNTTVAIGGKKLQFAMPASGWATVKYGP
jgi:hypothetical protein